MGEKAMSKIEVSIYELKERMMCVFTRYGVPTDDAAIVVDSLLDAEICGVESHGLMRVPAYADRLRAKLIDPKPQIRIQGEGAVLKVDGGNGLGQVVAQRAMQECVRWAKSQGCCFAAVSHSNHFGAVSYYTQMAAQKQMLGFACTSAGPTVAPFGGISNMLGTDPFSVAFPVKDAPAFVLDIAISSVAKGKIRLYEQEGKAIPEGWAIDCYGNHTTDPTAAIAGSLLPIAGHKGYGMALVVEALCALLSGAKLACETESMFKAGEPAQIGHFLGAIDIAHFLPPEEFEQRAREWFDCLRSSPLQPGVDRILIPGELEAQRRSQVGNYLTIDKSTYQKLCALDESR